MRLTEVTQAPRYCADYSHYGEVLIRCKRNTAECRGYAACTRQVLPHKEHNEHKREEHQKSLEQVRPRNSLEAAEERVRRYDYNAQYKRRCVVKTEDVVEQLCTCREH